MNATDLFSLAGTEQYEIEDEIGYGTFSEVHRAKSKDTGELVALKHTVFGEDGQRPIHVTREIEALQALNGHANVIKLISLAEANYSISLVLEHCATDLGSFLHSQLPKPLPVGVTKAILLQLLQALHACHSAGYIHRDISPGNLLVTSKGLIKLSDFGQARKISQYSQPLSPVVGTRWYRAPELLFASKTYDESIDMWSVGCIVAELLMGKPLFPGSSDIDQICKIRDLLGSLSEEIWPGVKDLPDWGKLIFPPLEAKPLSSVLPREVATPAAVDLLDGLLHYDPSKRLTAKQALEHQFFKEDPLPAQHEEIVRVLLGQK